jgi:crossover junction endodeoxyribonuclease RusA
MPILHTDTVADLHRGTPGEMRGQACLFPADLGPAEVVHGDGEEEARRGIDGGAGEARHGRVETVGVNLPYPISVNRYYRNFRGMTVVSKEAKAYNQEAALRARLAGMRAPLDVPVALHVRLLPKLTRRGVASLVRLDLDNVLKVTIDALNGIAYVDDRQVVRILVDIGNPVPDGGLYVKVSPA